MKTTKRALFSSVVALILCFSMLVGTTFAWFTDEVKSDVNKIVAGNLDVNLYWSTDANNWAPVQADTNVFEDVDLWEPGKTQVVYLKVVNEGTLALKYQLGVNVASETAGTNVLGDSFKLSDYIMFNVVPFTVKYETRDAARQAAENGATALNQAYASQTTKLLAKTESNVDNEDIVALIVYMPETIDNVANYKTSDDASNPNKFAPVINLGINLFATQVEADLEKDSFGSDYDQGAPIVSVPVARPDTAQDMALKGAEDVVILLPAEVVAALPAGVEEIGMAVSEPVIDDTNNTVNFESVELVDQNGDVIDLEALNLGEKITVTLPLPAGHPFVNGDTVIVYHDGEYMATAVVDGGAITYEVAHLCEITIGTVEVPVVEDNTVKIGTAAELFGFAQTVNSGKDYYAGKTVVLTNDIDLKNAEWTPIGSATKDHGFMGNFDGNGKTISNLTINNIALDADGYAYAGFFGITEGEAGAENVIKNLTIKNVTINTTGHIVAAAIAYPYYTTVKNITVCGNIAINGGDYTAGVLAYTRRCTTATMLTINGNEDSYITGRYTVGGVLSDLQTNGGIVADYSNFAASGLTITGEKCVGGICGIISRQNFKGATVQKVTLVCSDARVGIVSGSYDSQPVITDVTYSDVTGATAVAGAPYSADSNAFVEIDGVKYVGRLSAIEEMLKAGETTVNFACDINGDLTIVQQPGVEITINGNGNKFNGVITVDGKSARYEGAALTIQNVNFEAETLNADAFIRLGHVDAARYTNNVTVKDCTFSGKGFVAVKSYTGGDWNVTLDSLTVYSGMHSLAQLKNVEKNLVVTNCTVNSKNGLNVNNGTNLTMEGCNFNVQGYAVRFGESANTTDETFTITNSTLKSACAEAGDAVIEVRAGATNATLNLNETNLIGDVLFKGTTEKTKVMIDGKQLVTATTLAEVMAAAKNGNVIIDAQGANLGDFNYNGTFGNGTVLKNAKFTYVYGASVNGTATFENCEFVSDHSYSANFSDGSYKGEVIFNNCLFDGWSSFGDAITGVEFNNCTFQKSYNYGILRFYQNAELNDCTFESSFEGIDTNKTGTVVKFNNCNGIEGKIYNNGSNVGVWYVNGTDISADVTSW